ncbi:MAG: hypothetical protein EZS28_054907 [Streblomastix strix]|uniref:Uncharacterized protein n=1 Tax=Streblomastix strix TaxID=222440 RepID=A0A5J4QCF3_9EUKA|nr:MAG: hypothetical protein EZS28_054907 [Streblomastix strix]
MVYQLVIHLIQLDLNVLDPMVEAKVATNFVKNVLKSARIVYRYAVIAIQSNASSSTFTTQFFTTTIGQA